MSGILEALAPNPLIAILRAPNADAFGPATETLYKAGFRCVEFTLTTSGGHPGHEGGPSLDAR